MTAYDTDLRTLASDMLDTIANAGFGQAVTITHTTVGAYDPSTGAPSVTTSTETGSGVVVEYPISIRSHGGQIADTGSLVLSGNKNLLLSALKSDGTALTAPVPEDKATIGGIGYTITAVAPVSPAGTVIYYDCNIKGAN